MPDGGRLTIETANARLHHVAELAGDAQPGFDGLAGERRQRARHQLAMRRLGAEEKDYFLGLPPTGVPDTRTGPVETQGAAT